MTATLCQARAGQETSQLLLAGDVNRVSRVMVNQAFSSSGGLFW